MSKTLIKFSRGPRERYNQFNDDYKNKVVFFAEDKNEIIVNRIVYATPLKLEEHNLIAKVEQTSVGTLIFTKTDGSTITISIPLASSTTDGLMSKEDKRILDELPEKYATKEDLKSEIFSVYKFKGTLDRFEDLPEEGERIGDTYNILEAFYFDGHYYNSGTNVSWNGESWDPLGGDNIGYSKEEVDKIAEQLRDEYIELLTWEIPKTDSEIVSEIKKGGEVILYTNLTVPDNKSLTLSKLSSDYSVDGEISGISLDLGGNEIISSGGTRGDTVEIQKSNVILKNGKINSATVYNSSGACIAVMGQSNVILENLTVSGERCVLNSASGNTVTIKSGTYTSPNSAECVYYSAGNNSKIIIEGGRFESQPYNGTYYTLNIKDGLVTDDVRDFIEVRGGEFVNFNPQDCDTEGKHTNFVADGKTVQIINEGSSKIYKIV